LPRAPARRIVVNVELPIALVAALVLAVVGLALVLWSTKRHSEPRLHVACDAPIDALVPTLAGLTHGFAIAGNAIELHENGELFDVLLERIGQARRSVHFETFLWKDGALSERVAAALTERARAGVTVRVIVDGQGGKEMGEPTRR